MSSPQVLLAFQSTISRRLAVAGTQGAQSAVAAAHEAFHATVAAAQAPQTGVGAARERFVVLATGQQGAQTGSAAAREKFVVVGAASQSGQLATAAARERFNATVAASQASQTGAEAGRQVFVLAAASVQPSQSAAAALTVTAPEVRSTGGAVTGRRIVYPDWRRPEGRTFELSEPRAIAAPPNFVRVSATQPPNQATARLHVVENEDWLLLLEAA